MNISKLIKNVKTKVDAQQQRAVNKKAQKLAAMKKERVKLEGRAKILSTYNKEKEIIEKAKLKVREKGTIGQLKKELQKHKKQKAQKEKKDTFGFGGHNPFE